MPETLLLIQTALVAALDGVISVPVFDHVPQGQAAPYLVISDGTDGARNTMGAYGGEQTITLIAVSEALGNAEALGIVAEAEAILRTPFSLAGRRVIVQSREFLNTVRGEDGRQAIARYRWRTIET
jgi:hypothetical protein